MPEVFDQALFELTFNGAILFPYEHDPWHPHFIGIPL